MRVEVWSDLVCPWCFVGKRRFEQALAGFAHRDQVQVVHRSFELDERFPRGQVENQTAGLARKYGLTEAQARARQEQLQALAAGEGLQLRLVDGLRGNTFDAHRLVHLARERGLQDPMMERLLRAHFVEQRSLFDHDSLTTLAAEAGLDREEAGRVLAGDGYAAAVRADEAEAHALGAHGVPFFVFDRQLALSGAQPPAVFSEVLAQAWADAQDQDEGDHDAAASAQDP
jgi:predicted DsbA family dithiol-disulfide isomerase